VRVFRISSIRHAGLDGAGAALQGGRWNSPGRAPVYAAETYAGALLEVFVRLNLLVAPTNLVYTAIDIPDDMPREEILLAETNFENEAATRRAGNRWLDAGQTAVLLVPSAVTRVERNVLLNTRHADFRKLQVAEPREVWWDRRLFKG
jgi:RES domain-containing protein